MRIPKLNCIFKLTIITLVIILFSMTNIITSYSLTKEQEEFASAITSISEAIKDCDLKKLTENLDGTIDKNYIDRFDGFISKYPNAIGHLKQIFNKFDVKVNNISKDEQGGIEVSVSITSIDFKKLVSKSMGRIMLENGYDFVKKQISNRNVYSIIKILSSNAIKNDAKTITFDYTIHFSFRDGKCLLSDLKQIETDIKKYISKNFMDGKKVI